MVSTAQQKSTTHYHLEDIPDESLATTLDMRDSAATSMEQLHERSIRLVEHTSDVINDASRVVGDIRRWAKRNNNGELVSAAVFVRTALDTAWEALKQTYQVVEAARQVATNDKAVIDTQLQQLDELAGELELINNAIEHGDTGNARFENLMRIAREEISEDAQTIGYENAELAMYADVQHYIRYMTGIEDYGVTSRLMSLISGTLEKARKPAAQPTRAEIKAFKHLLEAINAHINSTPLSTSEAQWRGAGGEVSGDEDTDA